MQKLLWRKSRRQMLFQSYLPQKGKSRTTPSLSLPHRVRSQESRRMIQLSCMFFNSVGKKTLPSNSFNMCSASPLPIPTNLRKLSGFLLPLQTGARNTRLPFGSIKRLRERTLYLYIVKNRLCFQASLQAFSEAPPKDVTAVGYRPLLCYSYLCWPH